MSKKNGSSKVLGFNKSKKVNKSTLNKAVSKLYRKYANGFERPSVLLNLEPRMMFDGAAPAAIDEIVESASEKSPESLPAPAAADDAVSAQDTNAPESTTSDANATAPALDVDGIADSLELPANAAEPGSITAEDATSALAMDGVDSNATPIFGATTSADADVAESRDVSTETENVADAQSDDSEKSVEDDRDDEPADVDEVIVEEPKVTRVVFIDTSVANYEDLLDGVVREVELGSEDDAVPTVQSVVEANESADADSANSNNAPPAEADTTLNQNASNQNVGADASIEDADYSANEDGAIIIDGVAIYLLDPADNQVEEITNILSEYTGLDAIDIISHGAVGEVQLGNQRINSETLSNYADQISAWGDALAENGDILLYGCDVAGSAHFLSEIAMLTDADVAASDDETGNAEFGGDWELEASVGSIESVALLAADTASAFAGVLAPGDADDDGILDVDDDDDDNDGILDVSEGSLTTAVLTTTTTSQIPTDGGATVAPHNVIDLSTFTNPATGSNYAIGDQVTISNIDARGDLNGANETFDLTFNPGTGATESSLTNLNTGVQDAVLNPVLQDVDIVVTLVDTGGGVAGIVIAGSTDPSVGTGFSGITDMAYNVTFDSFTVSDIDTDGDGIVDRLDLDSDNDGISDLQESGADLATLDTDNDGIIDGADFADIDSDGVADANAAGTNPIDTDGDGIDNFRDLDSDGDQIADYIEGQSTSGYQEFNNVDADSDGILDPVDTNDAAPGGLSAAEDSDSDGDADYIDVDSDNDAITDAFESGIAAGTGDADSDGIDDVVAASYTNPDGAVTTDPLTVLDGSSANGPDFRTVNDLDGDGIADVFDLDDDNDGILDVDESGATLLTGSPGFEVGDLTGGTVTASTAGQYAANADWNGWNTPGTVDFSEGQYIIGSDAAANTNATTDGLQVIQSNSGGGFAIFSIANEEVNQTINVVAGETYEVSFELGLLVRYAGGGVATFDPNIEFGVLGSAGTNVDIEFDETDHPAGSNTIADYPSAAVAEAATQAALVQLDPEWTTYTFTFTADATGTVDIFARTLNSSSVVVLDDISLSSLGVPDYDQDGFNNKDDLDSDNDGISDLQESGADVAALDADGNGVIDGAAFVDADSDGLADAIEVTNGADTGTTPDDSDSDGIADFTDLDSDNDGIVDIIEGQSTAGYQDVTGVDADSDGAQDIFDTSPENSFGGDFDTPEDTDSDGVFDYLDTDSDSDGQSDTDESGLPALTGNDADSDGLDDGIYTGVYDPSAGLTNPLTELQNTDALISDVDYRSLNDKDNDGIIDSIDIDDDNDGIIDTEEGFAESTTSTTLNTAGALHEGAAFVVPTGDLNSSATDSVGLTDIYDGIVNFNASLTGGATWSGGLEVRDAGAPNDYIYGQPQGAGNANLLDDTFTLPVAGNSAQYEYTFNEDISNFSVTIGGMNNADAARIYAYLDGVLVPLSASNFTLLDPNITASTNSDGSTDVNSTSTTGGGGVLDNRAVFEINQNIDRLVIITGKSDGGTGAVTLGFSGVSVTDSITRDTDGDGIADHCDLDSDNDGLSDLVESGADVATLDADGNGVIDGAAFVDADSDGLADAVDSTTTVGAASTGTTPEDSESDGIADYIDLDSDNDGIADVIEGQDTATYEQYSAGDADSDGIADVWDGNVGHGSDGSTLNSFSNPEDTDSDGDYDFRDTDSDSDAIADSLESDLTSLDNGFQDTDSDGIDDDAGVTYSDAVSAADIEDTDSDGEFDFRETDSDSDGIADSLDSTLDVDSDGAFDFRDTDSDSDGIADSFETTLDTDSDGVFDFRDTDSDSDGIADSFETTLDTDSDGAFDFRDTDSDSDGIADSLETTLDTDSDGAFDFRDTDSDSDGIADSLETTLDSDSDGAFDFRDTDSDSDGIADSLETTLDTDSDGAFDFRDTDSDSDGIADSLETTLDT
ncbi:MAG: DUF4347 domain-containing protein, partial [Arenicella sp.]